MIVLCRPQGRIQVGRLSQGSQGPSSTGEALLAGASFTSHDLDLSLQVTMFVRQLGDMIVPILFEF